MELTKESLKQDILNGMTGKNIASKYNVGTATISRKKKSWGLVGLTNNRKKLDTDTYRDKIKNSSIEVIEEYVTATTPIKHKCNSCKHEWKARPGNIIQGKGCPKCAGNKRINTEEYKNQIKNTSAIVLEEYVNDRTSILHKCKICDHEWFARPNDVKKGHSCPSCAGKNAHKLYIIEFPDLHLMKVGITNNVDKRTKQFGHSCIIHSILEGDPTEIKKLEKTLLKFINNFLYNTELLTSGNTETYLRV